MRNKAIATLIATYYLVAAMLLPLGDFSLLRDLPAMYGSYLKVADNEEAGVLDFIGDYLLNGKTLLGHNKHDQAAKGGNDIQYQHTAAFNYCLQSYHFLPPIPSADYHLRHIAFSPHFSLSDFHDEFFRPPLIVG